MPDPEQKFWRAVRAHRFHGLGFRRQVPLAGYVVDFICHDKRLIIQIDGGSHTTEAGEAADQIRAARLQAEGFRIIRFWNNDVMSNLEGVLQRLAEEIGVAVPPSQPSPTRGEGR